MTVTPLHYTPDTPARGGPGEVIALVEDYWQLAGRIAATEFVPKALRNRPEAVLAALLSGAERGLGPMQSLRSVHVIEGVPSLSVEAMRALVFAQGHEIEFLESSATKATVVGRRAGSDHTSIVFTWTLDRARRARLANKDNWQRHPEDMLRARATAELCKAVFPDVIAGLAVTEEIADELDEPVPTTRRAPSRRRLAPPPPGPADPTSTPPVREIEYPATATTKGGASATVAGVSATTDLGGIPGADQPSWAGATAAEPVQPADPSTARRIHADLARAFPDADGNTRDRWRHALVAVVTRRRPDGPQTSSTGISLEEQLALSKLVANIAAGQASIADGPDNIIELHAGGGWRYTITLDPVAVTVHRGDQETGETSGGAPPDPGEASGGPPAVDASPDQTSLDGLED